MTNVINFASGGEQNTACTQVDGEEANPHLEFPDPEDGSEEPSDFKRDVGGHDQAEIVKVC